MVKPIRIFGRKTTKEKLFAYIKKLIDTGITGTSDLAGKIGKGEKQTKRYLEEMAALHMITVNPESGRVVKTTMQEAKDKLEAINLDELAQYPEIAVWLEARKNKIEPRTLGGYFSALKSIFKLVPLNPKHIVYSRESAIEYWDSVVSAFKEKTGKKQPTQNMRTAFKNLLSVHGIAFAHKMGKEFNLGSEHDSYKKYAGVNIFSYMGTLFDAMSAKQDLESFLWMKIGLKTSSRAGALSSMTWDRIYFDNKDNDGNDFFKLEIFETKDKRNQFHLGVDGDWKVYYPNDELKKLLQEWRMTHSFRRFVWFDDSGSDLANKKLAEQQQRKMTKKLAEYYKIIIDKLDPLTKEYLQKRPNHIMCHNFAQACKDAGMSDEEIGEAGHWRGSQSVSWYCAMSEGKKKELSKKVAELNL